MEPAVECLIPAPLHWLEIETSLISAAAPRYAYLYLTCICLLPVIVTRSILFECNFTSGHPDSDKTYVTLDCKDPEFTCLWESRPSGHEDYLTCQFVPGMSLTSLTCTTQLHIHECSLDSDLS